MEIKIDNMEDLELGEDYFISLKSDFVCDIENYSGNYNYKSIIILLFENNKYTIELQNKIGRPIDGIGRIMDGHCLGYLIKIYENNIDDRKQIIQMFCYCEIFKLTNEYVLK